MHPIEHLRHVARASGAPPELVAREAALALAALASEEPASLVPACRRLVERHVSSGPIWWLSARLLCGEDPASAAEAALAELEGDPTGRHLEAALPDDATVLVLGWSGPVVGAIRGRGDLEVLAPSTGRHGGGEAAEVPGVGLASAAAVAELVLLDARAGGSSGVLCMPGALGAAAAAAHFDIPAWAVVGVGVVLPTGLWDAMLERLDSAGDEPWEREVELVPGSLISAVVGPDGLVDTESGLSAATCVAAPELLRPAAS